MFRDMLVGMWGRPIGVVLFAMAVLMLLAGCASAPRQFIVERGPEGKRRIGVTPGPDNPQTAKDHAAWAMYYTNHNNNAAAIASYSRAIEAAMDTETHCRYLIQRGMCLHNESGHSQDPNAPQDIAGAEADFNEAVRLCPENTWARQVRGMFYSNTGHPERALEDLDFLVAREPGNPLFRHLRASAYASRQQDQAAMRVPDHVGYTAEQIVAAVPVMTQALRQSVLTELTNMEPGSWILIHRGDLPIVNIIPVPQSGLLVRRLPVDGSEPRYEAWNWQKGEPCPAQHVLLSQ